MKKYILILVFVFCLLGILVAVVAVSNDQYEESLIIKNNPEEVKQAVSIPVEEEKINTYNFKNFPVEFSYSDQVQLKTEGSGDTEVAKIDFQGDTLIIKPNQKGIGLEEPMPEITETKVTISGRDVTKRKMVYAETGVTTYLIIVPYTDSADRGYSVMINYGYKNNIENLNATSVFDNIVNTLSIK